MILNPFFVDRYIALKKMESGIVHGFTEAIIGKVHAVNDPVCLSEYPIGQMMADKSVYPKN
jgi:chorismate-pyruvate lyase